MDAGIRLRPDPPAPLGPRDEAVGAFCRGPWVPIAVQALVFAALHGWGTAPLPFVHGPLVGAF